MPMPRSSSCSIGHPRTYRRWIAFSTAPATLHGISAPLYRHRRAWQRTTTPRYGSRRSWAAVSSPSETEQRLAKALANDLELAPLFCYNQCVETVRGSRPRVDLVWTEGRLIVELDGYADHGTRLAFMHDRHRDYELTLSGYTVLRLANDEIAQDIGKAIDKIREPRAHAPGWPQAEEAMADHKLTEWQVLLIWALAAKGGEGFWKDLVGNKSKRASKDTENIVATYDGRRASDRDQLRQAKLITVELQPARQR